MNKVSILMPVCAQGDEARMTVASAKEAIGDLPHEIIVVDDQCVDNSARWLPKDVLVLRTRKRLGCSGSRKMLERAATGDVLVWTDPHCRFPVDSLKKMAIAAENSGLFIEPKMRSSAPGSKPWYGSKYVIKERGISVPKSTQAAHPVHPALFGSIYVVRKDVFDGIGGWPVLPGYWGCLDTLLSLVTWALGVQTVVVSDILCVHKFAVGGRFPYSTTKWHHPANAHWMHKAMFPQSYEEFWRPLILKRWEKRCPPRVMKIVDEQLESRAFKRFAAFIASKRLPERTEAECFRQLLDAKPPQCLKAPAPQAYMEYVARQESIAKGTRDYKGVRRCRLKAMDWLADQGDVAIETALDVGPRDGFIMQVLAEQGAEVHGLEISAPAAERARSKGLDVVQGDVMKGMPYGDGAFGLVTGLHILEHCPDPETALREMWRVMRPGGVLFIVVPREEGVNGVRKHAHYSYFPRQAALEDMMRRVAPESQTTLETGIIAGENREIRMVARKPAK